MSETLSYFDRLRKIKLGELPKEAVAKPRKPIKKVSDKRKAEQKADKELRGDNDTELEQWFKERRKEMKGQCSHCGGKSCRDSDQYYKFSICHILPKSLFPSVATHEFNFIELCFWTNNCHGNMDNNILDLIDMNCWDEIVIKFCIMYPSIAPTERRKIPQVLLNYIEVEK